MDPDISPIIEGWEYDPEEIIVRMITARDGTKKLQMRLDLGLIQMDMDGRPDGRHPHGFGSLLDYQTARAERARDEGRPFRLTDEECVRLQQEALQYYYRYTGLFQLGDYRRVCRDTERNLRALDFVCHNARDPSLIWAFQQYRPYILMMAARAKAHLAIEEGNHTAAIQHLNEAIRCIEQFYRAQDRLDLIKSCPEIQFLQEWRLELEENQPLNPGERLRREMEAAVAREEYELAARLRDKIKGLADGKRPRRRRPSPPPRPASSG